MSYPVKLGHAIDLTQSIQNGMTTYIGDPIPRVAKFKRLASDGVNMSIITVGSHTGTHVDAPAHFVKEGITVDEIPVEGFVGEAVVVDFSDKPPGSAITESDLLDRGGEIGRGIISLLYTGVSRRWGDPRARRKITYIDESASDWLARKKVKAVGIDYLSVEKFGSKTPVAHLTLLSHGIPIIESLNENLSQLVGRRVLFVCLPLKVEGCDGAPARAMAYILGEDGRDT